MRSWEELDPEAVLVAHSVLLDAAEEVLAGILGLSPKEARAVILEHVDERGGMGAWARRLGFEVAAE